MSQDALQRYAPVEYLPGEQVSSDDEAALEKAAGAIGTTIFHPVGTAKMGRDDDASAVVDARLFRYGGRRPQSKESALVTLADHIESAARALKDDTGPVKLAAVVDAFVNRALTSDLLASCDVTLKELERARAALKDALITLYRGDVERERSGRWESL